MATPIPLTIKPLMVSGRFQLFSSAGPTSTTERLRVRIESEKGQSVFWFDVTDCPACVTARVHDTATGGRGSLVEFTHPISDEECSEIVWDAELAGQSSSGVLERLAGRGLTVFNETLSRGITTRTLFQKYILTARPDREISIHTKTGWSNDQSHYVLGQDVYPSQDQISLIDDQECFLSNAEASMETWQKLMPEIDKQPMWRFAAQLAFAGPLINVLKIPQASLGGFVFYGGSGKGKSYANMIGQAVTGANPITFSATRTALEDVAFTHNDRTLFLDELHQAGSIGRSESSGSAQIGQVIYDLANGCGKLRRVDAKKLEKPKSWQLLWLGTGEISSADYIRPALGESKEGQRIRAADIPADHPDIHTDLGINVGRDVCGAIQDLAPKCGGAAGRHFIYNLTNLPHQKRSGLRKRFEKTYLTHFAPLAQTGTQTRLAERCALVAFAGELAEDMGLLCKGVDTSLSAALSVFKTWQSTVGCEALDDVQRCAQHVVQFIDSIRGDRLIELKEILCKEKKQKRFGAEPRGNYRNFAGFVLEDTVYLTPKIFRQLCAKFGGTPSVSRVFNLESILETNCGVNSYQYQLAEVRTIVHTNMNDETELGKVVWRRNSKTYALNLNELERYAHPERVNEE